MIALALLLAQAATAAPPPDQFSILNDPCPASTETEVVVCGGLPAPRLPLPAERGPPDRPMPSNPELTGTGALAAGGKPCSTLQKGCTVGVDFVGAGVAVVRLVGKLIDPNSCCEAGEATDPMALAKDVVRGAKHAFGKKPDKSNRVAIALDAPPPSTAGRLMP